MPLVVVVLLYLTFDFPITLFHKNIMWVKGGEGRVEAAGLGREYIWGESLAGLAPECKEAGQTAEVKVRGLEAFQGPKRIPGPGRP